jgi:hypothetical protein
MNSPDESMLPVLADQVITLPNKPVPVTAAEHWLV